MKKRRHATVTLDGLVPVHASLYMRWIDPIWLDVLRLVNRTWCVVVERHGMHLRVPSPLTDLKLHLIPVNRNSTMVVCLSPHPSSYIYVHGSESELVSVKNAFKSVTTSSARVYYSGFECPQYQIKISRGRVLLCKEAPWS